MVSCFAALTDEGRVVEEGKGLKRGEKKRGEGKRERRNRRYRQRVSLRNSYSFREAKGERRYGLRPYLAFLLLLT